MSSPWHSPRPVGIGLRSPHYGAVLTERPSVDFLEVHAENFFVQGGAVLNILAQARQLYPISVHGVGLSLGSATGIDPWHLAQLKQLVERIDPILISDHLCFGRGLLPRQGTGLSRLVHALDLLPVRHTQGSLAILIAAINQVQDTLQRPIALENITSYIINNNNNNNDDNNAGFNTNTKINTRINTRINTKINTKINTNTNINSNSNAKAKGSFTDYTEPDFLNELANRTGCGILLDLNNIEVNFLNHQYNDNDNDNHVSNCVASNSNTVAAKCAAYIQAIAPHHVVELHLAGCTPSNSMVIDDHAMPVSKSGWALYQVALQHLAQQPLIPTLIEWDTNLPSLETLLVEATKARAIAVVV